MTDVGQVAQFALNGVVIGGVFALAAVGLSLVYGILKLSNFAHGDLLTLGAYLAYLFAVQLPLATTRFAAYVAAALVAAVALVLLRRRAVSAREFVVLACIAVATVGSAFARDRLLVAFVLSSLLLAPLAMSLDLLLWRPLRRRSASVVTLLIVSIGVALVLRNGVQLVWGSSFRDYARPLEPAENYFGLLITRPQLVTLAVALVTSLVLHAFLRRTRTGKAMRALADNRDLARACGIDVLPQHALWPGAHRFDVIFTDPTT